MKARLASTLGIIALLTGFTLGFQPQPAYASGVVGNGTAASCTLAALNAALTGGGMVTFQCGGAPVTIPVTATISISAVTTIDGGNLITLDGGGLTRVIVNHSTLTVQNLHVANGYASGTNAAANGGGIESVYGSTLTVTNCQFTNNISAPSVTSANAYDYGGGAIFVQGSVLTVSNSSFTNNQVTNGSGGAIHGLRTDLTINNTFFGANSQTSSAGDGNGGAIYTDGAQNNGHGLIALGNDIFAHNNSASEGGAIHIHMYQNSDATYINQSIFADNHVFGGDAQGGALYFGNGALSITNSLFAGNSVRGNSASGDGSGGAISSPEPSVVTIANSTLVGNSAYGTSYNANGGGFYIVNNTQPFTIINSTIAYNYAGWVGGGITGRLGVLKNTIVADNIADNGANHWGILQQCSTQLTDGGGDFQYPPKNPNPNYYNETTCTPSVAQVDPKLAPLTDNGGPTRTLGLLAGSPALGAGVPATCSAAPISGVDQRGVARASACDSGAYELVAGMNTPHSESIGIYRNRTFYLRDTNTTGFADQTIPYGTASQPFPVVGDWTGAGFDTVGVFDQANGKFTLSSSNLSGITDLSFTLGNPNDTPLSGRWSGTATHNGAGVFRPSNGIIYLKNALSTGYADYQMVLGIPGDIGVAGDWTGKGFDSPGVYRPGAIRFYLSNQVTNGSVYGDITVAYGSSTDLPIVADWIGQGHDGIGMFRPSNGYAYLKNVLTTGYADSAFFYGIAGDVPIAGRWQPASTIIPPVPPGNNVAPTILIPKAAPVTPPTSRDSIPGNDPIGD